MKSPKIKDKENFKSDKRKKFLTYKETPIMLPVDFSHIAGQERMKWFIQSAAKKKKKEICQPISRKAENSNLKRQMDPNVLSSTMYNR